MAVGHPPGGPGGEEAQATPGVQGFRGGPDRGIAPGLPQGEVRETQAGPLEPGPQEVVRKPQSGPSERSPLSRLIGTQDRSSVSLPLVPLKAYSNSSGLRSLARSTKSGIT